jgi:hypothetical protein
VDATDYGGLITSDPTYIAGEGNLQGTLGHAGAARDASLQTAKFQYEDPTNPHNILNQLRDAYTQGLTRTDNSLEARGIYNSGARTQADSRAGNDYSLSLYNAGNNFSDLVSQALQGYTQANDQYGQNHAALVNTVVQGLKNDPSLTHTTAHLVPNSPNIYGHAVYSDGQGNLYTQDGKPFDTGPVGPSAAVRAISNPGGVL